MRERVYHKTLCCEKRWQERTEWGTNFRANLISYVGEEGRGDGEGDQTERGAAQVFLIEREGGSERQQELKQRKGMNIWETDLRESPILQVGKN